MTVVTVTVRLNNIPHIAKHPSRVAACCTPSLLQLSSFRIVWGMQFLGSHNGYRLKLSFSQKGLQSGKAQLLVWVVGLGVPYNPIF